MVCETHLTTYINLLLEAIISVSRGLFCREPYGYQIHSQMSRVQHFPHNTAELCANIIYKFSCKSCQGSYIGSTTKQSRIRFFQHLGKSPRTNRPVTVPAHSTPRNHCHENDHQLSLNDFKIIDSANNEHELRILESLYIC